MEDRAEALAKWLLEQNRHGRSWRRIAREDYSNKVNFATLNKIALHGGKWVPKSRKLRLALGLIDPKPPVPVWLKQVRIGIRAMVKETGKALV